MTVTAYEARDLRSLRIPSQYIAYFILALYLFCAIGEFLNVEWTNRALPSKYVNAITNGTETQGSSTQIGSGAIIVVAAFKAGHTKIAGLLNGCLIFAALSAANSALYVASRVLYGMTRSIGPRSRFSIFRGLGNVWNKTGVPVRALFRRHKEYIADKYQQFHRLGKATNTMTFLESLQPLPAVVGLVGSLVIVFVFTTATWWDTSANFRKVAIASGAVRILKRLSTGGSMKLNDYSKSLWRFYSLSPRRSREGGL
ncbi:MAG: hypothetical protein LQ351_004194 [Letrouitia transgressa]|nr:MAG: hypothetical protein LQ351_004194 [Letrouitia transgressa]